MNKQKVILIDTGSESNRMMMSDVGKMKNAVQISEVYEKKGKLWELLFKIHFGFKMNQRFDIPFKEAWDRYCVLNQLITDDSCDYYVILVNDVIRKLSPGYLSWLQTRENIHVTVLLLDSYDVMQPYFQRCVHRVQAANVYSFQKSDCERFGFHYTTSLYSRVSLENCGEEKQVYDVYYIGADKGRIEEIYEIYKKFTENGLTCKFTIVADKKNYRSYKKRYGELNIVRKRISYSDILSEISKTRCILEICQKGQDGLTMRFYEALFYNKLLITNNASAQNHPLFHPDFMQYYRTVEDISLEPFIDNRTVEYGYKDQCSPKHFIHHILNTADKSKKRILL